MEEKVAIRGEIKDIFFHNETTGFTVLGVETDEADYLRVVGISPELKVGDHIEVSGIVWDDPKFGFQIKAETISPFIPQDRDGILRYLMSGMVAGIGPATAELIVSRFGENTFDIFNTQPERLLEVPGIGKKKLAVILESWHKVGNSKELIDLLTSVEVSPNLAMKICAVYGDQALQTVQEDPFQLIYDVPGVGFATADQLAARLHMPKDHPKRIRAGLIFNLHKDTNSGHVFSVRHILEKETAGLLGLPLNTIASALTGLGHGQKVGPPGVEEAQAEDLEIVLEDPAVYLRSLYQCEVGIAEHLVRLSNPKKGQTAWAADLFLPRYQGVLSDPQQGGVAMALKNPVSILTGGPGTGKTHTMKALIEILQELKKRFVLAAPTGRAAKRLAESTRCEAKTIHRLLGFTPDSVEAMKNEQDPEDEEPSELKHVEMVVIDEVSMLDITLTYRLLKAIPDGCHLLLVGDTDQLPSVGPGNVLRDLIDSELFPVTRLTEIFRQKVLSGIVLNAHRINQGLLPALDNQSSDFFFFRADTDQSAADQIVDLVTRRMPQKFNITPDQIQVLVPMYKGDAGVNAINRRLQDVLNPLTGEKIDQILFDSRFRSGDRIMQLSNNYEKGVYNGDVMTIIGINDQERVISAEMDGRVINYAFTEADQLRLAYAVSVHKSQGSEYPFVLLCLLPGHHLLLQRNLIYTAITRAKQVCVLVGSRQAIGTAVHNNRIEQRNSALKMRVIEGKKNWVGADLFDHLI